MNKKLVGVIGIVVLIVGIFYGLIFLYGGLPGIAVGEPLVIEGDSDFESMELSGSGTESNPYIIEDLTISPNIMADTDCISIKDTTKHFVIKLCTLTTSREATCIKLENVSNAVIENCTISGANYGVYMIGCENITIRYNEFNSCYYAIGLFDSENIDTPDNAYLNCVNITDDDE